MNKYELMVLIAPQSSEAESKKIFSTISKLLTDGKVEGLKEDFWGERELAYKINKYEKAVYSVFTFKAATDFAKTLPKTLNLNDTIIRYLLTKLED